MTLVGFFGIIGYEHFIKYKSRRMKVISIINFFKGIAISVSTLVPGVSGGTMAIILGVYDDLIHSVGSFFEDWKKHGRLLLEIGLGAIAGIALFAPFIERTINNYPIETGFFFMGVVFGGVPVLYKRASSKGKNVYDYLYLIIGLLIALAMSREPEAATAMAAAGGGKSIIFLVLAGIIISVALILPGISGSFMLLILGLYDVTLNAINTLNIPFLIPLVIGCVIGTIATTKTIERLLNKHPGKTYMLILGFILGSILPIYPGLPVGINLVYAFSALCLGFLLIFNMGKRFNN
jgi:putative membrane protein